jgi:hypothetical protein
LRTWSLFLQIPIFFQNTICKKFRIVFCDVLPCKIIVDRRFRDAYCLHHQGWCWRIENKMRSLSEDVCHVQVSNRDPVNTIRRRGWLDRYLIKMWTTVCDIFRAIRDYSAGKSVLNVKWLPVLHFVFCSSYCKPISCKRYRWKVEHLSVGMN